MSLYPNKSIHQKKLEQIEKYCRFEINQYESNPDGHTMYSQVEFAKKILRLIESDKYKTKQVGK